MLSKNTIYMACQIGVISGTAVYVAGNLGASNFYCVMLGVAIFIAWCIGYMGGKQTSVSNN